MLNPVSIFADFNNSDRSGRVRLNTKGTLEQLKEKEIELKPGIQITLDDHDGLSTNGIVEFSDEEKIWVARINWLTVGV